MGLVGMPEILLFSRNKVKTKFSGLFFGCLAVSGGQVMVSARHVYKTPDRRTVNPCTGPTKICVRIEALRRDSHMILQKIMPVDTVNFGLPLFNYYILDRGTGEECGNTKNRYTNL